jgi:hypothetical protein
MGLPTETMQQLMQEAINCIDKQSQNFSLSGANIEKYDVCEDVILNHHQYKNKSIKEYFDLNSGPTM